MIGRSGEHRGLGQNVWPNPRARLACEQFRCIFIYGCGEILFDQFNDPFGGGADRRQRLGEHFRRDIVGGQVERAAMLNSKMRENDE